MVACGGGVGCKKIREIKNKKLMVEGDFTWVSSKQTVLWAVEMEESVQIWRPKMVKGGGGRLYMGFKQTNPRIGGGHGGISPDLEANDGRRQWWSYSLRNGADGFTW